MKRETLLVTGVGVLALLGVVAFLIFSPSAGDLGRRDVAGPPTPRADAIRGHAGQFDSEVPNRAAGSQQEQAVATYLLGLFQRNGYVVRLESVPVGDLVSSTDLIATPPGVDDPSPLVVVPYGAPEDGPGTGSALGVALEVSRALNVADLTHTIGFAAVGAEFTKDEGPLGSRRLARLLEEQGSDPVMVVLASIADGVELAVEGPEAAAIFGVGGEVDTEFDVFAEAGFTRYLIQGPPEEVASLLMEGLAKLQQ